MSITISREPKTEGKLQAKYGLPTEVKFCRSCVMSNQRPNSEIEFKHTIATQKKTIHFDEHGICDACRAVEGKSSIDWDSREKELRELCDQYRGDGTAYDCLVPGSGGKDSFYAAYLLKYKYNMRPLTVTWAPHIYTDWGWKNFQAWIGAGFDNYLMTPNTRAHRLLTRIAVENLFHPFQPFILGQKNLAPKMARLFGIKLIFYGENEAEYGNPKKDMNSPLRKETYFKTDDIKDIHLSGISLEKIQKDYNLELYELKPYLPIEEKHACQDIEVRYLGYYEKWHPQSAYYFSVKKGGFQPSPERTPGTYSKYNSIDDKIDDFHYYTTFIKFGVGRTTYDASQEIRSKDINRDEGLALVKRFDGEYPTRFENEIFKYLSIDKESFPNAYHNFKQPTFDKDYFLSLCDNFRSPHLWKKENNSWKLRHTVWS